MENILKQLDFTDYHGLIKEFLPGLHCMLTLNDNYEIIWASEQKDLFELEFNNEILTNTFNNTMQMHLGNNQDAYISKILSTSDAVYGYLVIIIGSNFGDENFSEILLSISNIIAKEVDLTLELNSMSSELEERYEELNLMYDSNDPLIESDSDPAVFSKLINSCIEYLDVAMTVLIMPQEDILLFKVNEKNKVYYINSILTQLKNYAFPWLQQHGHSVVSNELDDIYRQDAFPDIPYKIVCSPIYISNEAIGGILVTLNPSSVSDFTNSDRNILDTIAKKIAKVAMANYDGLTGLFKRNVYESFVEQALSVAKKEAKTYCLLHVDIDGMRIVNESIDKQAGDQLISHIAQILRENTRDVDVISRLMGDKFGILLATCSLTSACAIADNIRQAIQAIKLPWQNQIIETTACIGVAELNADTENIQSVLAAAELSAGVAKEHGRNIVQVYQQTDSLLSRRKSEVHWIREVQKALKQDKFELYCQPIQPIQNSTDAIHYEVLLRLFDDQGNMISPDNFIPAAERFRLMTSIDEWVIENTFAILSEYRAISSEYVWTINLSGLSLGQEKLRQKIIKLSQRFAIEPQMIKFEITETAAMNNLEQANNFINDLLNHGFSFALDDFGTGASTFAYLKALPVEYLKIDGSFIKEILDDPFAEAIVRSIKQISTVRKLKTVAEYVENEEILQRIRSIGVDYAQGYYIDKPKSLIEVLDQLSLDRAHIA